MFKIGEKVVCVNPNQRLVKGQIYEVECFENCVCGDVAINLIGVYGGNFKFSECKCGRDCSNRAHSLFRFRKLDYEFAENLLAEITEQMQRVEILN